MVILLSNCCLFCGVEHHFTFGNIKKEEKLAWHGVLNLIKKEGKAFVVEKNTTTVEELPSTTDEMDL
jgi:hypothetical protein